MASNTDYLPDEITYGFVADRVLLAVGDTASDDNRFPDGVPAQGTVRFSPERTILYTQQHPATVLPQDIECTIYHRDHPVAVNNGYEPELVGKLVDPAGHVGNVALIVGWYEAVYRLETGTAQRFRFQVLPEHTADNPLWLPEVAPLQPTPSERFVVNEQVYNDTKTARDEAEQYRDTTRTLRNETQTFRNQAEGYRNEAGQSATSAAEILSDVQDLGITVDTSVGTRVYVGDTMIHYKSGERQMKDLLLNGWETDYDVILKRIDETVFLIIGHGRSGTTFSGENATSNRFLEIPQGFRPSGGLYVTVGELFLYDDDDNGTALISRTEYDLTTYNRLPMSGTLSWPTSDATPATLPGTPA